MTIAARVIADSIGEHSPRLTTLQCRYPKFIHGEFMTHRVFSRNASSSRAIPVERLIKDVIDDPVYPSYWGRNRPGMSARDEHDCTVSIHEPAKWESYLDKRVAWDRARGYAVACARAFAEAGYHKQIVNRVLEPFCHINVVVTSTEWDNFFQLRCHPDAQPEMRELAEKMREAMAASTPRKLKPGEWHLPYILDEEVQPVSAYTARQMNVLRGFAVGPNNSGMSLGGEEAIKVSVARCARVSYLTQDGRKPDIMDDLKLYDKLVGSVPLHASPAEHQATPDYRPIGEGWNRPHLHGNFTGWLQYRKMLLNETA